MAPHGNRHSGAEAPKVDICYPAEAGGRKGGRMEKATAEIKKWQIALKSCSLNQPQALAVLSARLYLHMISSTILQMNNIEQPLANSKADIVFYRSFTEITRLARFVLVVQLIKVGLLAALIPVDTLSLGVAYGQLIICLILNLVASSLGLLQYLLLVFSVYCNIQTFVSIAVLTNHAISAEPITDSSVLENCVSASIFLAQDSKKEVDLTEQQRDMHKKVTKNMISFSIKQMHGWLPFLENLYEVITFGCMVYTIVVLATTSMPMVDTILLAIYVAVVGLFTTLHLVIGCVIMAVAPAICLLLCLICCCSACCCPNGSLSSKQIDVAEIEATNSQVINAQGSCSICMMSLAVKEKVYVLPCSEKHVFHGQCLRQWTRIKTTCPLCRAEIPARGQQENTSQEIGRASLEHQAAEVAQSL